MSEELPPADEDGAFVPPDPDEPPPVELWRVVGEVTPWGTLLLLLAWGAVFALQAAGGELGVVAADVSRGANVASRSAFDLATRALASTFLHASPGHVFFNAIAMLVFGPAVERLFTRAGFWTIYAFGGAAASWTSLGWRIARNGAAGFVGVGASGAIFALGGALLAASFRLRHRLAPSRARAFAAAILFLALPALAGGFQRLGTDNAAHAGGLLAGLALGAAVPLREALGGRREGVLARAAGIASAAALALSFVRVLRG